MLINKNKNVVIVNVDDSQLVDRSFLLIVSVLFLLLFFQFAHSEGKSEALMTQPGQSNPKVSANIVFQDDTIHLELTGTKNWNYTIDKKQNNKKNFIELVVDNLDIESQKKLQKFKSSIIEKIEIEPGKVDNKSVLKFHYSSKVNNLETFDYLVEDPSRLVVDFYQQNKTNNISQKNKSEIENEEATTAVESKASLNKNTKLTKVTPDKNGPQTTEKNKVRNPATADFMEIKNNGPIDEENLKKDEDGKSTASSTKVDDKKLAGIFDGGDPFYERFNLKDYQIKEESLIKAKENYYIPFPELVLEVNDWKKIKNGENIFEIAPNDQEDNKQARLLQTLLNNKRHQVFLKTYDWFMEKFAKSEYKDLVQNMSIQVHLQMWNEKSDPHHYDLATQKMKEVIQKNPEHPMAEKYSVLQGIMSFEKKDYFNSLRSFQNHLKQNLWNKKGSISADLAKIGVALSYQNLNQFDEAIKAYEDLEKESIFEEIKSEALYRKGDVKLREKKFEEAIKLYQSAIEKRPQHQNSFPNAFYNQAQAYFLKENFKQSLDVYREFIKKFPQDKLTPYAMTRVGEILDILGADKTKVIGAYLETYFRNGESPSVAVARLRLLAAKMKTMKQKEVDESVKEIIELTKKSDLPLIEQFSKVMIAEGYQNRGDYDQALGSLISYYKDNPTTVDRELFSKRIVSNIHSKIEKNVEATDFISALKIYNEYFDNWLKPSTRLDTKFLIGKAYEQGGVSSPAIKYYSEVLNKLYAIKGTQEGKVKKINEKLPSESELNLRLAAVETSMQNFNKAFEHLKAIKETKDLTEKEQIERVILASELNEKKGDTETAILYLTELLKYWKGQPEMIAEPYFILSQLELKKGSRTQAIKSLQRIDDLWNDTKLVASDVHRKSIEKLATIYDENKDFDNAAKWYAKLIELYEEKAPLASSRYRLGKIYFDQGEFQKASDTWSTFKGKNSESWKRMAQEQLRNSEWSQDYKKYINRIPAMEKQ